MYANYLYFIGIYASLKLYLNYLIYLIIHYVYILLYNYMGIICIKNNFLKVILLTKHFC